MGFWSQYSRYLTKRPDDGSLSKTTRPDTKTVGLKGMLKQRSSSNLNSTLSLEAVTGDEDAKNGGREVRVRGATGGGCGRWQRLAHFGLLLLVRVAVFEELVAPLLVRARLEMEHARASHWHHVVAAGESVGPVPICVCSASCRLPVAICEHLVLCEHLYVLRGGRRRLGFICALRRSHSGVREG